MDAASLCDIANFGRVDDDADPFINKDGAVCLFKPIRYVSIPTNIPIMFSAMQHSISRA